MAIAVILELHVILKIWQTHKAYDRTEMPDGSWVSLLIRVILISIFSLLALMCVMFDLR